MKVLKKQEVQLKDDRSISVSELGETLWSTNIMVVQMKRLRWRFIQDSRVEGFNFEEVASGDMAEKITKVDLNKMGTQPETGWELVSD